MRTNLIPSFNLLIFFAIERAFYLAIEQNHRNAHLGKRLILEVERVSKEKGCRILWIETAGRELYIPTRMCYLHNNYTEAARMVDFYAPGDDKVIYRKDL